MLAKTILLLASAALALASPVRRQDGASCTPRPKPVLPVNGGVKELPSPPSNVTLKHIALGFGVQNYSCASAGADPLSTGALAMLYDVTKLYPNQASTSLDMTTWSSLAVTALDTHEVPLNLNSGGSNPFPASAPLELDGLGSPIPFLGHHFFDADGVPTFHVGGSELLKAKKLDAVDAPADANKGPDGTGAVAWLYLGDKGGSVGLSFVYRVLTAGGNSHGCTAAGVDSTSYTTTYWFYG